LFEKAEKISFFVLLLGCKLLYIKKSQMYGIPFIRVSVCLDFNGRTFTSPKKPCASKDHLLLGILHKKNAVILNPFYARDNAKPPPRTQRGIKSTLNDSDIPKKIPGRLRRPGFFLAK
jgi:hypothetical protein